MISVLDIPSITANGGMFYGTNKKVVSLYADTAAEVVEGAKVTGMADYELAIGSECITGDWKKGRYTSSGWVWKDE